MKKVPFSTNVAGQDCVYLSELLLAKGYEVHGVKRRNSFCNSACVDHLHVDSHEGKTGYLMCLKPEHTANADGIGIVRLLEAVRYLGLKKKARIYQASTSEWCGKVEEVPQRETTPFCQPGPYAAAKLHAYRITTNFREGI